MNYVQQEYALNLWSLLGLYVVIKAIKLCAALMKFTIMIILKINVFSGFDEK